MPRAARDRLKGLAAQDAKSIPTHDLAAGVDGPPDPPCTYCNKRLLHVLEPPLGCYEESRFAGRGGRKERLHSVFTIFTDYQEPYTGPI